MHLTDANILKYITDTGILYFLVKCVNALKIHIKPYIYGNKSKLLVNILVKFFLSEIPGRKVKVNKNIKNKLTTKPLLKTADGPKNDTIQNNILYGGSAR